MQNTGASAIRSRYSPVSAVEGKASHLPALLSQSEDVSNAPLSFGPQNSGKAVNPAGTDAIKRTGQTWWTKFHNMAW